VRGAKGLYMSDGTELNDRILGKATWLVTRHLLQKSIKRLLNAWKIADDDVKGKSSDYVNDLAQIREMINVSVSEISDVIASLVAAKE
jgi:hypothetical protein